MDNETEKKRKKYREVMDATIWFAACEQGHEYWDGPNRSTQAEATNDARAHDINVHAGLNFAVVLSL